MQTTPPDDILVQSILHGDQSAFRVLVSRYQNLVFTIVLRIVGSREEAEEAAQDVFMKVYANLASFEGKSKMSSWIYRIAYNTALTRVRNKRAETSSLDAGIGTEARTGRSGAVYNEAEKNFRSEYVDRAIKLLDPADATILTLFYLSEQSLEEIALIQNIEPNAAKVRLHRARKKLREKMEAVGLTI